MSTPRRATAKKTIATPRRATAYKKTAVIYRKPAAKVVYAPRRQMAITPRRRFGNEREHEHGSHGFQSVGGQIGSHLGNVLGHGAQMLLKALTGFGDYTIDRHENTMFTGGMQPAQIVNSINTGGTILRHREYLRDVLSSDDFESSLIFLNPGQAESFPWLAGIAANYEKYRFRGLVIEFKSLSSDSVLSTSASSGLGSVMMATNYNVNDAPFANKEEMLNYEYANSRKPSESFYHPVETKNSETATNQLYVRTGDYALDADPRLSDLGRFQISTQGMQGTPAAIGELWITFEVELFAPKTAECPVQMDIFDIDGCTTLLPLAIDATRTHHGALGGTIRGDLIYAFPSSVSSGTYKITYYVLDDTPSGTPLNVSGGLIFTNCTFGSQRPAGEGVVGALSVNTMLIVNIDTNDATIQFPTATWTIPDPNTNAFLIVEKYLDSPTGQFVPPQVLSKLKLTAEYRKYKQFLAMEAAEEKMNNVAAKRGPPPPPTPVRAAHNTHNSEVEDLGSSELVTVKKSYLNKFVNL